MYIEEWQADITVHVDGKRVFDKWATASGGVLTATDEKTRPGGMGDEVSCGGPATRSELTCTVQMTDLVAAKHKRNESYMNLPCSVTINWLNMRTKKPIPNAGFTRRGTVKEFGAERRRGLGYGRDVPVHHELPREVGVKEEPAQFDSTVDTGQLRSGERSSEVERCKTVWWKISRTLLMLIRWEARPAASSRGCEFDGMRSRSSQAPSSRSRGMSPSWLSTPLSGLRAPASHVRKEQAAGHVHA